ncbi:MAG: hypothetical protein K2H49_03865, partial [Muribaculaceae bacterium]|nr:hypothetical protein [Muribaculaceae bacterium]
YESAGAYKLQSFAKPGSNLPDIIVDTQGRKVNYLESGDGYFFFLGLVSVVEKYSDNPTNMVYSDDGKVYIYNIIPRFPTEAYVEGRVEGDNIIVSFPQPVLIEKRDGNIYDYYVDRLEREMISENQATYWPSEKREVVYKINEDGSIEMEKSGGEWCIGITSNEGLWQGYADWDCVYVPNNYQLVSAPEGLVTEKMQLITNYTGYDVNVGFDGDNVYVQGICHTCPDSWIKGKLEGDRVTFENGQYLGTVPGYNLMGFFFGGMAYPDEKWVWAYALSDNLVMEYDKENRTFKTDQTIIINDNDKNLHYMYAYRTPQIHPFKNDHSPVPMNPSPISFQPYGISGNCIGFKFYLPNLSEDNYILPKDEIYWSLYIDDELYTFEPYLFEGLKKDMTEVPFNCDLEDIENDGETVIHTIYIPIEDFEKVGYVSIHKVPGKEDDPYYSDIVEFNNPQHTGVVVLPEDTKEATRIFDLNGIQVDKPVKGHVYIVDKGSKTVKKLF